MKAQVKAYIRPLTATPKRAISVVHLPLKTTHKPKRIKNMAFPPF